ncbi:hypothetical protein SmJEL517_g04659 [Synchytrium microbalum]|uniref:Translation initiation factor eIF2B subunit epsilon n=1 Tax=Synchytrium microbalum TaxID=1806994 RepID=A0A507C2A9_9FUNG|nr:uncharacterized protein SmJEL517_g04659 [Synchytrium microbalum]TPX32224.1 hypothetical protein SmJEL517_g04659 [Synchytrium microbalum]
MAANSDIPSSAGLLPHLDVSGWVCDGDLQKLLNQDETGDSALSYVVMSPPTSTKTSPSAQKCTLHICMPLNYVMNLRKMVVISSTRVLEVFSEDNYVSTVQGQLVDESDDDEEPVFSAVLPIELTTHKLSIRFPSIRPLNNKATPSLTLYAVSLKYDASPSTADPRDLHSMDISLMKMMESLRVNAAPAPIIQPALAPETVALLKQDMMMELDKRIDRLQRRIDERFDRLEAMLMGSRLQTSNGVGSSRLNGSKDVVAPNGASSLREDALTPLGVIQSTYASLESGFYGSIAKRQPIAMPPKQNSNKNIESEEVLQAIVVADSFNNRFQPLTQDEPRCLLPLVNVPLLEYTLEFLAVGGVQEIYVLTCAHADKIKDYIRKSKWNRAPTKITTVETLGLRSMGDALREVDRKGLVKSDFILISGDVVSNMSLEKALATHKARRAKDKNSIMTMLVPTIAQGKFNVNQYPARGEEALFIIDAKTHECVHYEPLEVYPPKSKIELELEWFQKHPDLQVRNDLIDCQIDICSLDVPALFQENFDYQHIRTDFVRGVLESDVLTSTIHCYVLEDEYAARVRSTHSYDSVSKDIIGRWAYPMVPDSNIADDTLYYMSRRHVYLENPVFLTRSAVLSSRVCVGSHTSVESDTNVSESVIGRNCKIGEKVTIDGSYIWDNTEIKAKSRIQQCIIGRGVKIHENVMISRGCIIGSGVELGPNITVPPFSKLSIRPYSEDQPTDDELLMEGIGPSFDRKVVGTKGKGYLWPSIPFESDLDDLDARNYPLTEMGMHILCEYVQKELDKDDSYKLSVGTGRTFDPNSIEEMDDTESEDDESDDDGATMGTGFGSDDEDKEWKTEAEKTLQNVFVSGHTVDDIATELNTNKYAHNATFHDIRASVIPFLVGHVNLSNHSASAKELMQQWGAKLLVRYAKVQEDQVDCLEILHSCCAENEATYKVFAAMLRLFYEHDIAEEDAVMKWHGTTANTTGAMAKVRELAAPLVKFLQEADEEDSDEEDSD